MAGHDSDQAGVWWGIDDTLNPSLLTTRLRVSLFMLCGLCLWMSSTATAVISVLPKEELYPWLDGAVQETKSPFCGPHVDGTLARVGYWGEPDKTYPKVYQPYWLRLQLAHDPNACRGVLADVEISLPPDTELASSFRIECYDYLPGRPGTRWVDCPQQISANGKYNPGIGTKKWSLPIGAGWEFWFPVWSKSELFELRKPLFRVTITVLDNPSPSASGLEPVVTPSVMVASVKVFVAPAESVYLEYPSPSTTNISARKAHSVATLFNQFRGGTVYWDLGTTTTYGYTAQPQTIAVATTDRLEASVDWDALQPGKIYHWRFRFVGDDGTVVTGDDQQFETLRELRPNTSERTLPCRVFGIC